MKYVCIDNGAVEELISGRGLQSLDFVAADKLLSALKGDITIVLKIGAIIGSHNAERLFLSTPGPWKDKKFLVIDCETTQLFTTLKKEHTLASFQKLLRFCARFWRGGGNFTRAEHIVQDSTKAILFPLGLSDGGYGTGFRIAVEREPDKKRLLARDLDGKFLLAYRTFSSSEDVSRDQPSFANFRRAVDALPKIYSDIPRHQEVINKRSNLKAVSQTIVSAPTIEMSHLTFEQWIDHLTKSQTDFVFSSKDIPHRLVGPAGSGKTLALILKVLRVLNEAEVKEKKCRALLVTHSEATRSTIKEMLVAMDEHHFQDRDPAKDDVSLSVETLASLCARTLKSDINESEFIDRDAQDSKLLQQLIIEESIKEVRENDYNSHKPFLSEDFRNFFSTQDDKDISHLFQHEISVLIKGRADDQFDEYKALPSLKYGLPVVNDADKGLVFQVFLRYQAKLEADNKFDTDDVVLSAVGQLHTPIWRRRRATVGFDFIAIDETHLFNINELHMFHHFTKSIGAYPISFSIDLAQSVGDRGWSEQDGISSLFQVEDVEEKKTNFKAVFRCSPEIMGICASILSSGATLFTDFQDSLIDSGSAFTFEEERRCVATTYRSYISDDDMIAEAFKEADRLSAETSSKSGEVLITTLSEELLRKMESYVTDKKKPITILDKRGDFLKVESARRSGHFVLGHADYVGGLEFGAAVIVGVDRGRVPMEAKLRSNASTNFMSYSAHNRLYVASSRARFGLSFLGVKGRGPSDLLSAAIRAQLIDVKDG